MQGLARRAPGGDQASGIRIEEADAVFSRDELRRLVSRASGVPGDILAVLVRSRISEKHDQVRTLASLKLAKIGDSRIGPDEGWYTGQLSRVNHLVRAVRLPDAVNFLPVGSVAMSSEFAREMESLPDGSQTFRGGEFVEWHKGTYATSILWSCSSSLPSFLESAESIFGRANGSFRGLVDLDGQRGSAVSADQAIAIALAAPERVSFLRVEFEGDVALTWTPEPASETLNKHSKFSEAALIYRSDVDNEVVDTMTQSATKRIGSMALSIVEHISKVQ